MSSDSMFGLAIVGCGQIVTHHLEAIMSMSMSMDMDKDDNSMCRFEVRALCDPSVVRRDVIQTLVEASTSSSSSPSIRHFDTLDDLILDQELLPTIDVIFIAVPHDLHEALACQALEIQPHKMVVMEKPLAPTKEACDRLIQASLESSKRLIIAEQSPFWQEVTLAKTLIAEDSIGTIVSAAAYYYESMRDNVTSGSVDEQGGLGWRGSIARAGGGIAMDGGLHWIRPLREMCGGRIEKVVGVVRRNMAPELQMEGESLGHALFQIAPDPLVKTPQPEGSGDLVATYSCNMLATAPMAHDTCPYFRITGNQGEIVIHGDGLFKEKPGAGGLRLYNEDNPLGKEMFVADRKGGFFLGFRFLWQHISRIVGDKDGAAAHETVVRASDDVRVVLALYKSSKTEKWESTSD
jgi:UDP-N-acetyl-2-amino-2-deoxyglucuronate dehydrogenase